MSIVGTLQLASIAELFSRVVTVASAWVHLLAVDLYAAKVCSKRGIIRIVHSSKVTPNRVRKHE
eukprot:694863-Pyramimonas_sp.AAC.2